jgi:hypothetical protein
MQVKLIMVGNPRISATLFEERVTDPEEAKSKAKNRLKKLTEGANFYPVEALNLHA